MTLSVTAAMRADIDKLSAFAAARPCDFTSLQDTVGPAQQQLERYSLTIDPQIRVYYVHLTMADNIMMAHLSIHGASGFPLDDTTVDQLADAFGLGPRSGWRAVINRPPEPSAHVFKVL